MRKIIHIDMDCFYAACEVKRRPDLNGRPIGIGGPPDSRSVLCTANYEARKFKVKSAMPSSQAVRLCPDLVLIPPNFDLYKRESRAVREIFERFTDKIEPLSLDEAYLDVTGVRAFDGSATKIAQEIRSLIETELKLTASAGVAPNKFLAKIASDWNKPNGLFVIKPNDIEDFVKGLKVEQIFGVGKVTAKRMHRLGLKTCADIQKHPLEQLKIWFGSRAESLLDLSFGIDNREVESSWERKSLTVEETFAKDISSFNDIRKSLANLFSEWEVRMNKYGQREKIRGHVVKLKFYDFKSMTRETSSKSWPTLSNFISLLEKAWDDRSDPIRLLGLGVRLGSELNNRKNKNQLSFDL